MKAWRLFDLSPTGWLTLEKLTQQGMWLLLFLVLAPILGPKPYGLFTIVMAFIGFCETVIVDATAEALVTVREIDDAHLQTANLCTLALSLIAAGAAYFLADLISAFFDTPDLAPLFRVLSVLPVVSALTATPIAVLSRALHFRALAVRSIAGLLVGGVAAVTLALHGAGVWALVVQILTQRFTELGLLWASAGTRLGFRWSRRHFNDLRSYATSVGISKAMAWSGGQIPRVILGWYLGPADLGLFALAARMVDFITQVFVVPWAWVARLALREFAEDRVKFGEELRLVMRRIAVLTFPVSCGLAAIMPTLFSGFLDQRWQPGIVPAQILVLTGIPAVFYYCFTAAVLAARQPHLDSKIAIATHSTTALAVLIAGPYGLQMACAAILAQRVLMMPAPLWMLRRVTHLSSWGIIWAQLPLLAAAGIMAVVVFLLGPISVAHLPKILALAALILVGVLTYIPVALIVAPDVTRALWRRVTSHLAATPEPV
jgi:O-antigen/teichoic acid export membrane protein